MVLLMPFFNSSATFPCFHLLYVLQHYCWSCPIFLRYRLGIVNFEISSISFQFSIARDKFLKKLTIPIERDRSPKIWDMTLPILCFISSCSWYDTWPWQWYQDDFSNCCFKNLMQQKLLALWPQKYCSKRILWGSIGIQNQLWWCFRVHYCILRF